MPLKSIDYHTPFFKFYNTDPLLDNLRIYGCLCYVSTLKVHRDKFSPRARPCVFIGYPAQQKGYKVLDLLTSRIHVSRDVIFNEHHFPYHIISQNSVPNSVTQYVSSIFIPKTTNVTTPAQFDDVPFTTTSVSPSPSITQVTDVHTNSPNFSANSYALSTHTHTTNPVKMIVA